MFKQFFGDPRRKSITIAFLNNILKRKDEMIIDVHYENTERIKEEYDGKTSKLDVLVSTSNGERINVEIQIRKHPDFPERVLYYWSKLYSSSIGSGDEYSKLVPTIMISILNYPLFPQETDSFHNEFKLMEVQEHFHWCQHLEFHVLDLSQFMLKWKKYKREMKQNRSSEYPWLMMLTAANHENKTVNQEMIQELEEFAMNEQEIREALIEWETLSSNKENKILYESRLKFLRDQLSLVRGERKAAREEGLAEGLAEGRAKGLAEGRAEGRAEGIGEGINLVAKNMLNNGKSIDEIMELTGLTQKEILLLKNTD